MENLQLKYVNRGYLIVALSAAYFVIASYAILFSTFLSLTGVYVCYSLILRLLLNC